MEPNNNQAAWKGIYDTLGNISKSLGELNTGAPSSTAGSGGTKNINQGLLDALTERLTSQGKGIVSSSTSGLQDALSGAISDTQKSGDLTRQALQSEREREVSYSQDRAAAQYTNALESRSGFATMTYGLRELTETTEKSIRDLDKRYQEAILTNDAATAQRVSDLRVKQLEMQQDAEARYMDNLFKAASMQVQQNQWQSEFDQSAYQFDTKLNLDKEQFNKGQLLEMSKLAQDADQFNRRLAQDKELAYAQIAAANARASGGNLTKDDKQLFNANVYSLLQNELNSGNDVRTLDPISAAALISEKLGATWDIQALGGAQINTAVSSALSSLKKDYSTADPTFNYGYATTPQNNKGPSYLDSVGSSYTSTYKSMFDKLFNS